VRLQMGMRANISFSVNNRTLSGDAGVDAFFTMPSKKQKRI
jgi:hypothetical protein